MATKIFVIVTPERVYATQYKTIVHNSKLCCNNESCIEREKLINSAKATAFNYCVYISRVQVESLKVEENWKSIEVFNFLEKKHNAGQG
jgi:hypothetical protein